MGSPFDDLKPTPIEFSKGFVQSSPFCPFFSTKIIWRGVQAAFGKSSSGQNSFCAPFAGRCCGSLALRSAGRRAGGDLVDRVSVLSRVAAPAGGDPYRDSVVPRASKTH